MAQISDRSEDLGPVSDDRPVAGEIRPWPVPGLLQDVDKAVHSLPANTPMAVIGYANQDEAGFAVVARKGEHWSFVGKLQKPWDNRWEYGAAVVWTP